MAQPPLKPSHFHQNSTNRCFLTPPERHCRSGFDRTGGVLRHQCFFLLQFIPLIFSAKLSSFSGGSFAIFAVLYFMFFIARHLCCMSNFIFLYGVLSYALHFFFQYLRCFCSDLRLKSILRSYHRAFLFGSRD